MDTTKNGIEKEDGKGPGRRDQTELERVREIKDDFAEAQAQFRLGNQEFRKGNLEEAEEHWKSSSDLGFSPARCNYLFRKAHRLEDEGKAVEARTCKVEVIELLILLADDNWPPAKTKLDVVGRASGQFDWYESGMAYLWLATVYSKGIGVERDAVKGGQWFMKYDARWKEYHARDESVGDPNAAIGSTLVLDQLRL